MRKKLQIKCLRQEKEAISKKKDSLGTRKRKNLRLVQPKKIGRRPKKEEPTRSKGVMEQPDTKKEKGGAFQKTVKNRQIQEKRKKKRMNRKHNKYQGRKQHNHKTEEEIGGVNTGKVICRKRGGHGVPKASSKTAPLRINKGIVF